MKNLKFGDIVVYAAIAFIFSIAIPYTLWYVLNR